MAPKKADTSAANAAAASHSSKRNSESADTQTSPLSLKLAILLNVILIIVVAYLLNIIMSTKEKLYSDCTDYFRAGSRQNGIYEISPENGKRFNVYCNMTAGGWTAIMRRDLDINKIDFYHDLTGYKNGFGDLLGEHFLGLDRISLLTTIKDRELMLVVNDSQYRVRNFKVLGEFYHYKLVVQEDIDKMPDGTTILRLNNTFFSALDVDFDLAANGNCSTGWKAGWWFTDCYDHSVCMTGMSMHSSVGVKRFTYSSMLIK